MQTRNLSLVFVVTGFIYSVNIFFIFLSVFGEYDLSNIFGSVKDYLPYISVIIFFLSYIVGIIMELILQKIVSLIKKTPYNAEEYVNNLKIQPDTVFRSFQDSYQKLVIIRHSTFGSILLLCVTFTWILKSEFLNKCDIVLYVSTPCLILSLVSLIAYGIHRSHFKKFKETVNKLKNHA